MTLKGHQISQTMALEQTLNILTTLISAPVTVNKAVLMNK